MTALDSPSGPTSVGGHIIDYLYSLPDVEIEYTSISWQHATITFECGLASAPLHAKSIHADFVMVYQSGLWPYPSRFKIAQSDMEAYHELRDEVHQNCNITLGPKDLTYIDFHSEQETFVEIQNKRVLLSEVGRW
ncbi:hypothetical protein FOZ60_003787 [Perkinsus olseni]|uniref:Uncharacterized protein n=1 Tax=Perkinsus olseni TaxID=32597 RepID=A0A7J6NVH5_PEROL|nr:hypothetical protein FOZ60_003787 [Perkinsus olseni]